MQKIKRYLLLIVGLFFSAVGVAVTKHGELGVSPVSSVANTMSYRFPDLSMGNWLIVWNCVLILGQVFLLRKKFRIYQLLQIPVSFLFGYFTDLGTFLISLLPMESYAYYALRLLSVCVGTILLAFGIVLSVAADTVMNSGEAFVKALSDTVHKNFGSVKIVFDITCVLSAVVLSMLFFGGKIVGAREGTLIAAVCTGLCVKIWMRLLQKPLNAYLGQKKGMNHATDHHV